MAATGSRGGNTVGMVVAFVLVAGLMYWLNVQARATEVVVVEDDAVEAGAEALDVAVDTFGANPGAFRGQNVRVGAVAVQALVGSSAFFVQVPSADGQPVPYLIKMDSTLIADGMTVVSGDQVVVVGVVRTMNDGIADQWVVDGLIGEGDKIIVTFAENYIEASEVALAGG